MNSTELQLVVRFNLLTQVNILLFIGLMVSALAYLDVSDIELIDFINIIIILSLVAQLIRSIITNYIEVTENTIQINHLNFSSDKINFNEIHEVISNPGFIERSYLVLKNGKKISFVLMRISNSKIGELKRIIQAKGIRVRI